MGDNLFVKTGKFFRGYVTVQVEGIFLEKFTNLCAVNCLPFWNVKRYGIAKMIGRTTVDGYRKMKHISKKCGCRIKISKKRGIPFFIHRYRKRKIFIIGALLFFALIKLNGLFIWNIEVIGAESDISKEILAELDEIGIRYGIKKKNIDVNNISSKLMIKRSDLSWVGVEIDGMRLKVKIVEKAKVPNRIDEKAICNIVASKPGMIVSINTLQGTQMVENNSIVDKGDVLVLGMVEMTQFPEKTQYVHSLAEIEARVWYERIKTLKLSSSRTNEEIINYAYNIAYDKIMREIPRGSKILNVTKNVKQSGECVTVDVIVETLEDIGVKEIIQSNINS